LPKFLTAAEAVSLVQDGQTLATSGFRFAASPEELFAELGRRYAEFQHPRDLTVVFSSAQGDDESRGLDHLAQPGMLKRVIGGFFGVTPKLNNLVTSDAIEAYNLPQGQLTRLYHAIATRQPGLLTHVGLGTFLDPRLEGAKLNAKTTEEIIEVVTFDGREHLLYRSFPVHVAFIRATTADEKGNLSCEKEAVKLEALPLACAARASGGIVIAQVERLTARHTLHPRLVEVPGYMVDVVVVATDAANNHRQTLQHVFTPQYSGHVRAPISAMKPMSQGPRRIIASRCVDEIRADDVVNLGSGMPEGIGLILSERGLSDSVYLTLESGVSGGVPATQPDFGVSTNPDAIIRHDDQFCFFNAGGIDVAFLGFAQVDPTGSVNVSKFNGQVVGCGGFVDIAQNAKKVIFCGTFNSGGLDVRCDASGLSIVKNGRHQKFIPEVEQITFSGDYARQHGQRVLYVTERCVFELTQNGLTLTEVAPGVDVKRDILDLMQFRPEIAEPVVTMHAGCFQ
jgi:propionate CoA-transferase